MFCLGCGDSKSDTDSGLLPPNYDMTGTWNGDMTGSTATDFVLTITQNGNNITGSYTNDLLMTMNVTGTISADSISITLIEVPATGYKAYIVGSTLDGINASGTWSDNQAQFGNWIAIKL